MDKFIWEMEGLLAEKKVTSSADAAREKLAVLGYETLEHGPSLV